MKIRIFNAKILTNPKNPIIINGELWTEDDKISYVGAKKSSDIKFNREIDAENNLIMPGFKNAHSHSPMTFLRSFADDLPLEKWLYEVIFPMEAKLQAHQIKKFTKLAILEYIASGITAAFDMYYETDAVAEACIELGFRMVFCGAVNNFKDSVEKLSEYYDRLNNYHPLIGYRLGFHAEYTTDLDLLKEISVLSNTKKAPVFTHISETEKEVRDCVCRYGKTPIELFDSLGLFNYGGGGFHCVHLTQNDIDIIRKKNIWVVTNPAANLKLASGIADIQKLIDNHVNLAIGTDGPAGNNSLNMWKEMYLVSALQKYLTEDAAACPAEKVLEMATTGGALAMGLNDCDLLEVGKQADLIMINMACPNMRPFNNIIKNLVYSGSDSNVKLTMIRGRVLYENGEFFINEDVKKIYDEVAKETKDLFS